MKKSIGIRQFILVGLLACFANGCVQSGKDEAWKILFNGKDFTGWKQLNGKHTWEVIDGMIVGTTVADQPNGFLCTEEEFGDFILELEVSIDTLMNNSGVQFRSLSYPNYRNGRVHGYQMETDPKPQRWSGAIYEEGGDRHWVYSGELFGPEAKQAFKRDTKEGYQWNTYRIECIGPRIRTWVNGVPAAHLVDDRFQRGFIGLQLHANQAHDPKGDYQVRFRNIRIQTGDLQLSPLDDIYVVNTIPNNLSTQEEANGLKLLWDGRTTDGWLKPDGSSITVEGLENTDNMLCLVGRSDDCLFNISSDIITKEKYKYFELNFDFKYEKGATGGVVYLADALENGSMGQRLLRYQIIDDKGAPDTKDGVRASGSLDGLLAAEQVDWFLKAPGEWNQGIIRVSPNHTVEHWLNGYKVLEYHLDSLELMKVNAEGLRDKKSAVNIVADGGYLILERGVSYRSIKIREFH